MAKRRHPEKLFAMPDYPVFVDTNLDTGLALILSHSDTIADLKEEIMCEHSKCFPKLGEIKILSVKVKRRGSFYHLPDSMPVRTAFQGIKKSWFLSADIFCANEISEGREEQKNDGLLCYNNYVETGENHLLRDGSYRTSVSQKASEGIQTSPNGGNADTQIGQKGNIDDYYRELSAVTCKKKPNWPFEDEKFQESVIDHKDICHQIEVRNRACDSKESFLLDDGTATDKFTTRHEEDVFMESAIEAEKVPDVMLTREGDSNKGQEKSLAVDSNNKKKRRSGEGTGNQTESGSRKDVPILGKSTLSSEKDALVDLNVSGPADGNGMLFSHAKKKKRRAKKSSSIHGEDSAISVPFAMEDGMEGMSSSQKMRSTFKECQKSPVDGIPCGNTQPSRQCGTLVLKLAGADTKASGDSINLLCAEGADQEGVKKKKKNKKKKSMSSVKEESNLEDRSNIVGNILSLTDLYSDPHLMDGIIEKENILNGADQIKEIANDKGLGANQISRAELSEKGKVSDQHRAEVTAEPVSPVIEAEMGGKKRKTKTKKSAEGSMEKGLGANQISRAELSEKGKVSDQHRAEVTAEGPVSPVIGAEMGASTKKRKTKTKKSASQTEGSMEKNHDRSMSVVPGGSISCLDRDDIRGKGKILLEVDQSSEITNAKALADNQVPLTELPEKCKVSDENDAGMTAGGPVSSASHFGIDESIEVEAPVRSKKRRSRAKQSASKSQDNKEKKHESRAVVSSSPQDFASKVLSAVPDESDNPHTREEGEDELLPEADQNANDEGLAGNKVPQAELSDKGKDSNQNDGETPVEEPVPSMNDLGINRPVEPERPVNSKKKKIRSKESSSKVTDVIGKNHDSTAEICSPPKKITLNKFTSYDVQGGRGVLSSSEADQTDLTEEEHEPSLNHNPYVLVKRDAIVSTFGVCADEQAGNDAMEASGRPSQRTKRKKTKHLSSGEQEVPHPEHIVSAGVSPAMLPNCHTTTDSKKDEFLPTSSGPEDREENVNAIEEEPLKFSLLSGSLGNAVYNDDKLDKKDTREQNLAHNAVQDSPTKEEGGLEILQYETNNSRENTSDSSKKSKRKRSKTQSAVMELELNKSTGIESSSFVPDDACKLYDKSPAPSSLASKPDQSLTPVPKVISDEDKGIDFKEYFVPFQGHDGNAVSDEHKEAVKSKKEMKAKKKRKGDTTEPKGPLMQKSIMLDKDHANEDMSQAACETDSQLGESGFVENSIIPRQDNTEKPKVADGTVQASSPYGLGVGYTKNSRKSSVNNVSGTGRSIPAQFDIDNNCLGESSSERSYKMLKGRRNFEQESASNHLGQGSKTKSDKKAGEALDSSQQNKSLLTAPGKLFQEDSSESSGNEGGILHSDANTLTPSESSSSSEVTGKGGRRKGRCSSGILNLSEEKNVTIDMILERSNGFKRAKLTATHYPPEDSEEQPVDFVPDSQAN